MVRLKGLDQMGNKRFKSGTNTTTKVKMSWSQTALWIITMSSNTTRVVDIVMEMGAEDLLVCDDFHAEWGIDDDPSDEKIVLYLAVVNPDNLPQVSSPSGIARLAETISLLTWRSIGTDAGPIMVIPGDMDLGDDVEIKAATGVEDFATSDSGLSLAVLAHSTTVSACSGVWQASGHKVFNVYETSQPMSEWAGYEMEEIFDCEEEDYE